MAHNDLGKIMLLLDRLRLGDEVAKAQFFELVEERLRALAWRHLCSQQNHHTLGATGVAHEALIRMNFDFSRVRDSHHLHRALSKAVRHVLIDYARKKHAEFRGGKFQRVPLLDNVLADFQPTYRIEVLDLHEALVKLVEINKRAAAVVDLRIFGGYTMEEIAKELGLSLRSVENGWHNAKAWLYQRLHENR